MACIDCHAKLSCGSVGHGVTNVCLFIFVTGSVNDVYEGFGEFIALGLRTNLRLPTKVFFTGLYVPDC